MNVVAIKAAVLTAAAALTVASVVLALRPHYEGRRAGRADENYLTSDTCLACHADHHASWARTHHSRMTQEARPAGVQGDFERDNTFAYLGVRARMEKRGGAFYMHFALPDGSAQSHRIERTVGSRRIEQYLTRQPGGYARLPLAYDLVNRRWMSLNGAFFYPDGDNFFQHQAQWDGNCVFCHNVKAQPNMNFQARQYNTEVTELGIACGACHGAAASHAERGASPFTRSWWRFNDGEPRRIINPAKLPPEKSLMVCGHCHGQRVPEPRERIRDLLTRGDPYNAGDDLARYYTPVWRDTKIGDFSFASRFWADGSPRLTAYEYQGVLRSACFTRGAGARRITCLSCHSMHEGDARGQIKEENRTNQACLSCHQEYEGSEALAAHTRHGADSTGSNCYNCHMPRVVYGVMAVHPTHEITVPDPARTAALGVPNACNQCHLDRSVNWAIRAAGERWPARYGAARPSPDPQFDEAEGARALFAGDALTRALAAEALGGGGPAQPHAPWAMSLLIEAFEDNYPVVRFFAANGLARHHRQAPKPDYLATPEARRAALAGWRALLDPAAAGQARALAGALRRRRVDVDLEVGE